MMNLQDIKNKKSSFWILHVTGWLTLALIYLVLYYRNYIDDPKALLAIFLTYIIGFSVSLLLRYFYQGKPYVGSREEKMAAARELAKLNNVLSSFDPTVIRTKYRFLTDNEINTVRERCKSGGQFEQAVLENLEWIIELSNEIGPMYAPERRCYSLQHWDYHTENIIITNNNEIAAILDFEHIEAVPKNLSVAFACDRFSDNVCEMFEFIDAYRKVDESLCIDEIKEFPALIKWEALCRINYVLQLHFFEHNSMWNKAYSKQVEILKRTSAREKEFFDLLGILDCHESTRYSYTEC